VAVPSRADSFSLEGKVADNFARRSEPLLKREGSFVYRKEGPTESLL
jgi:hypothetical protein